MCSQEGFNYAYTKNVKAPRTATCRRKMIVNADNDAKF